MALHETVQTYEQHAAWYASKQWSYDFTALAKQFTDLLPGKRILDLGCGAGRDAAMLASLGDQVVGIDASAALLEYAKQKAPTAKFQVMDFTQPLRFRDASFDGIWASASLLHVQKNMLPKILLECNRILVKRGILYISVKLGEGEHWIDHPKDGKRFFALYREQELWKCVQKANFTIIHTQQGTKADHKGQGTKDETFIQIFAQKKSQLK
ncbi:MAG TPA: methyltransferase domain-containing protein [Candidatus Nanoarchaeia archaeon]|nr:methyltransferase domain-containing protein [Candidatus Nanoarchaeia archaeon]